MSTTNSTSTTEATLAPQTTLAPQWQAVRWGMKWYWWGTMLSCAAILLLMAGSYLTTFSIAVSSRNYSGGPSILAICIFCSAGFLFLSSMLFQLVALCVSALAPGTPRIFIIGSLIALFYTISESSSSMLLFSLNGSRGPDSFAIMQLLNSSKGLLALLLHHNLYCCFLLAIGYELQSSQLIEQTKGYLISQVISYLLIVVLNGILIAITAAFLARSGNQFFSIVLGIVVNIMIVGILGYRFIQLLNRAMQLVNQRLDPVALATLAASDAPPKESIATPSNPFE